jgi:hypothetical protein
MTLPKWNVRLDAFSKYGFSGLSRLVNQHFRIHESVEKFLSPYNARQRSSSFPYRVPDLETLRQMIKPGGMNEFSYRAYLNSIVKFCEITKGQRGLPLPHPSSIHSLQLPEHAFSLRAAENGDTIISIIGIDEEITVKKLQRANEIRFIIIRPKLGNLGTASAVNWEVLFFKTPFGYIPEWLDSQINTRYVGKLH